MKSPLRFGRVSASGRQKIERRVVELRAALRRGDPSAKFFVRALERKRGGAR